MKSELDRARAYAAEARANFENTAITDEVVGVAVVQAQLAQAYALLALVEEVRKLKLAFYRANPGSRPPSVR